MYNNLFLCRSKIRFLIMNLKQLKATGHEPERPTGTAKFSDSFTSSDAITKLAWLVNISSIIHINVKKSTN